MLLKQQTDILPQVVNKSKYRQQSVLSAVISIKIDCKTMENYITNPYRRQPRRLSLLPTLLIGTLVIIIYKIYQSPELDNELNKFADKERRR